HWYEMCDAVQDESYEIDGVAVSNFVLPLYFTGGNEKGGRNDFLGKTHLAGRCPPSASTPAATSGSPTPRRMTWTRSTETRKGPSGDRSRAGDRARAEGFAIAASGSPARPPSARRTAPEVRPAGLGSTGARLDRPHLVGRQREGAAGQILLH